MAVQSFRKNARTCPILIRKWQPAWKIYPQQHNYPESHQIGTLSCEIGHLLTMWHIWGNGTVFSLWLIVHVLTLIYTYLSNSIFVLDFASKKLSLSGLHSSDRREDKWVFPGKSRFPLSLLSLTLHCPTSSPLRLTGLYLSSWFIVVHLQTVCTNSFTLR